MAAETLLALWNDTPTRRAIVELLRLLALHADADREFASA